MPTVQIPFPTDFQINVSLQVGDMLYYCEPINNQAGTNHPTSTLTNTKPKKYGTVVGLDRANNIIQVETIDNPAPGLEVGIHYLMFGKDRRVNTSGIIGYFAEAEYRNYTTLPAEMFATAADWVESSK